MDLLELLFIGIMQGLLEWLPVSSEGQAVLFLTQLLQVDYKTALSLAIFLHVGTMVVVIIYFRTNIINYIKSLRFPINEYLLNNSATQEKSREEDFYGVLLIIITTIGTGITAIFSLFFLEELLHTISNQLGLAVSEVLMFFIGVFLLITGYLLSIKEENKHYTQLRSFHSLTYTEAFILGLLQGFSALPGISRSGTTLATLFYLDVEPHEAFKGSFLISVPAVMGSTVLLMLTKGLNITISSIIIETTAFSYLEIFIVIITTFTIGLLTIDQLLKYADKVSFAKICYFLGFLTMVFALLGILLSVS